MKKLIFFSLIIFFTSAAFCLDTIPILYKKAAAFEKKSDLSNSLKIYQQIISLNDKEKTALNNIGVIHLKLNNKETALNFFNKALAIDEYYMPSIKNKIIIFYSENNYSEVIPLCKKYLSKSKDDFQIKYFYANSLYYTNEISSAFDIAVKLKNEYPDNNSITILYAKINEKYKLLKEKQDFISLENKVNDFLKINNISDAEKLIKSEEDNFKLFKNKISDLKQKIQLKKIEQKISFLSKKILINFNINDAYLLKKNLKSVLSSELHNDTYLEKYIYIDFLIAKKEYANNNIIKSKNLIEECLSFEGLPILLTNKNMMSKIYYYAGLIYYKADDLTKSELYLNKAYNLNSDFPVKKTLFLIFFKKHLIKFLFILFFFFIFLLLLLLFLKKYFKKLISFIIIGFYNIVKFLELNKINFILLKLFYMLNSQNQKYLMDYFFLCLENNCLKENKELFENIYDKIEDKLKIINLIKYFIAEKDVKNAVIFYEKLISLPDLANEEKIKYNMELSNLYKALNKNEKAIELLEKIISDDNLEISSGIYKKLIENYELMNQFDNASKILIYLVKSDFTLLEYAIEKFEKYYQKSKSKEILSLGIFCYNLQNNTVSLIPLLKEILKSSLTEEEKINYLKLLGDGLVKINNKSEALKIFFTLYNIENNNLDYLINLANLNYDLENFIEAGNFYLKILDIKKDDIFCFNRLNDIGLKLQSMSDFENSVIFFEEIIKRAYFEKPEVYYNLAKSYLKLNKTDLAIKNLQKIKVGVSSFKFKTKALLAKSLIEKNMMDAAKEELKEIDLSSAHLDLETKKEVLYLLVKLNIELKNSEEAKNYIKTLLRLDIYYKDIKQIYEKNFT